MKILLILSVFCLFACNSGKSKEEGNSGTQEKSTRTEGKWSNEDQVNFMNDCIENAGPDIKNDSIQIYCACMLTKTQVAYPNFKDAVEKMRVAEVDKWAMECLGR